MAKHKIYITPSIFSSKPQQIIKDSCIKEGQHYSENQDFLHSNLTLYENLFRQAVNMPPIFFDDKTNQEHKTHLMLKYSTEYRRNMITLINLTFSEN